MKKIIALGLFCLGLNKVSAQKIKEAEVPAIVKEGFKKSFPNLKAEEWEKEGTNFEVEFDQNKTESSALFDTNGNLLETEIEITAKELPKNTIDYLTKNIPSKKIKEASKTTNSNGVVTYEAEVNDTDYIFDSTGNFIKKEVEKDDKDDNKNK
ncbi:MAG: hypothetical protein SFY56_15635 [Bacteroidota bacterium]|nr:hypothetical protein [Bacteroidota bacterium]